MSRPRRRRPAALLTAAAAVAAMAAIVAPTASASNRSRINWTPPHRQVINPHASRRPAITITSPTDGATITTNGLTVDFAVNRYPRQIASETCSLTGDATTGGLGAGKVQTATCTPIATPTGSSSTATFTGLINGTYTFKATVVLTDGGTATASETITINAPPACTAGLENFSEDANNSTPTVLNNSTPTTPAGTITTTDNESVGIPGQPDPNNGSSWPDYFGNATPYLDVSTNSAPSASVTFAFTVPVGSTSLDIYNASPTSAFTLTAYNAAGAQVGTPDTVTVGNEASGALTVSDTTDDIASVVLQQTTEVGNADAAIPNMSWGC